MSQKGKILGDLGEIIAESYLKEKKYDILDRNYKSPFGEVDIIARDPEGTLVFVEVKTRKREKPYRPEESVGRWKRERILKTSLFYLKQKGLFDRADVRYDVIAISSNGINHIKGAFDHEG